MICDKCGCYIPNQMRKCPACGAENAHEKSAENIVTFDLNGEKITASITDIQYVDIEGPLSGRTVDGTLVRHVITTKRKFNMAEL